MPTQGSERKFGVHQRLLRLKKQEMASSSAQSGKENIILWKGDQNNFLPFSWSRRNDSNEVALYSQVNFHRILEQNVQSSKLFVAKIKNSFEKNLSLNWKPPRAALKMFSNLCLQRDLWKWQALPTFPEQTRSERFTYRNCCRSVFDVINIFSWNIDAARTKERKKLRW